MKEKETYSCVIVDDEPLAQDAIEMHLNEFTQFAIIAKCSNALEAFEVLSSQHVDLMFLDIQMPKIDGISFLKNLRHPPSAILTSAFSEYALDGYDLDVIDYLLKPISFERFLKAINKFLKLNSRGNVNSDTSPINTKQLIIKADRKNHIVKLEDILFLESMKDYVKVKTLSETILTKATLSSFEIELPDSLFLRIHRSYIININHITSYDKSTVYITGSELPIGRIYSDQVIKKLSLF